MKNKNFVAVKRAFALLIMIAALGLSVAAQDLNGQLGSGNVVGGGGTLGSGSAMGNGQLGSGGAFGGGGLGSGSRVADSGSVFGGKDFWAWITSFVE